MKRQAWMLAEPTQSSQVTCHMLWPPLQYVASCWNHDGDPVELLKLGSQVAQFRKCLEENPKFLQEKVKQYFKVRNLEDLYL